MSLLFLFIACSNNTVTTEKVVIDPPLLSFVSPEDGEQFVEFNLIGFSATVQDEREPLDQLRISWTSSIDGQFNNAAADTNGIIDFEEGNLSAGEHEITLQVTNSEQLSISEMHNISIISQTESPIIELLLPVGDFAEVNVPVLFKVITSDPNFALEELSLSFYSNTDSEFCTPSVESSGEGSCEATLSLGEHQLNFSVTNPNQLSQFIEIDFLILPPSQIDNDQDGYTEDDGDCDDSDSLISPNGVEIINDIDDDCDGQIDNHTDIFDDDGDGYAEDDGDCDDEDPLIYPDYPENCDGLDNDCNGIIDDGTNCFDDDGDGWTENDGDCDDENLDIYPNSTEDIDGIDNNCDGHIDEGSEFFDDDGDCYCESEPCYGSFEPTCTSFLEGDCDDSDLAIFPTAHEFCNSIDNDCNGLIDDNPYNGTNYYPDLDSDGYGDANGLIASCSVLSGYVTNSDDCNDTEVLAWTGRTETCDYVDNDCNGLIDDGALIAYYEDSDLDGYGNPNSVQWTCTQPTGYVTNSDDCNDTEALAWTGRTETCDTVDNDCNGQTDEGLLSLFYTDADGDGYGDANSYTAMCSLVAGYSINSNDCDDTEALAWTGRTETCDYVDNDCNGQTDEGVLVTYYQDSDGDGHGDANTVLEDCTQPIGYVLNTNDCNDSEVLAWYGAAESCDYIDNNCDGQTDEGVLNTYYADSDLDGYGTASITTLDCTQPLNYVSNTDDCDDTETLAYTGASEDCDYVDNDCNGSTDEGVTSTYYRDADGDSYGDPGNTTQDCAPPTGYTYNSTDCYDSNASAYPSQTAFFTTDRGDGSFDYDCNSAQTQQYTSTTGCNFASCDTGWDGSVPSCGQSDDYAHNCNGYGFWICDFDWSTPTQSCR